MLVWAVMNINQAMFGQIDNLNRSFLQFMSFTELFIELVALAILVGVVVFEYFKKDES